MRAVYDLSCCPPSFDVVSFLLWIEQERLARGEAHVEIDILPGPAGGFRQDSLWPHTIAERIALRDKIVVPMCSMLPSAKRVTVCKERFEADQGAIGYGEYSMHFRRFVAAMSECIRPLRPRSHIKYDPERITITLRECDHWPERNSNLPEWLESARRIERRGYRVVFVRDTLKAGEVLPGYTIDPAAAIDLDYRGALYRSSACNLFVSNGPAWFAMACGAATIMFKPANDALGRCYGSEWLKSCGIPIGSRTIPGASAYQTLVWKEDTADVILDALSVYFNAAECAA